MEKKGWCWVERGGERGKRKKRGERSVQRQGEDVDRLGGGGGSVSILSPVGLA